MCKTVQPLTFGHFLARTLVITNSYLLCEFECFSKECNWLHNMTYGNTCQVWPGLFLWFTCGPGYEAMHAGTIAHANTPTHIPPTHTHLDPSTPSHTHLFPPTSIHNYLSPHTHTPCGLSTSCCGECVSMYSCARPTPLNLIPPSLVRRGSRTRVCVWGWGGGLSSSSNRFFNLGVMEGEYL